MAIEDPLVNPAMLSGFQLLQTLVGDEFVEVVAKLPDGSFKNYKVAASKLRTGASAYDVAVINGFIGTEPQWLKTLIGKSAYEIAVLHGLFSGTEAEWALALSALYQIDPLNVGKVLTVDALGHGVWKNPNVLTVVGTKAEVPAEATADTPAFVFVAATKVLYAKSGDKYDAVSDEREVPVRANDDAIDLGTNTKDYVSAKQVHDFVTLHLGFTRDVDGNWIPPTPPVTESPLEG